MTPSLLSSSSPSSSFSEAATAVAEAEAVAATAVAEAAVAVAAVAEAVAVAEVAEAATAASPSWRMGSIRLTGRGTGTEGFGRATEVIAMTLSDWVASTSDDDTPFPAVSAVDPVWTGVDANVSAAGVDCRGGDETS